MLRRTFTAKNGRSRTFNFREGTNDQDVIQSAFVEDEYGILGLDFEEGDVVIDIGAHIGAVTLLFTTIEPKLRIFALEPMPANFALLKENVLENRTESEISIFRQAVWFYDDDDVKIYYGDSSPNGRSHRNIGSLFLIHDFYRKDLYKKVNTITLSKLFDENRIFKCKFIKMDCEGAEYGILKGTPKPVLEMIDRIHGEYHWVGAKPLKNPRSTLALLAKGVFNDTTKGEESKPVGPFIFVKK